MYYTIGQRKGIGIGNSKEGNGQPYFVADKNLKTNELIVSQGDTSILYSKGLITNEFNIINTELVSFPLRCTVKFRYRQKDVSATMYKLDDGRIKVLFDEKQRAVTLGQVVVGYLGNICIGGGAIDEIIK